MSSETVSDERPDGECHSSKRMSLFQANVDDWGASMWFARLCAAIKGQDAALLTRDDIAFETYRSIAASSAMRLVRDFGQEVQNALDSSSHKEDDIPMFPDTDHQERVVSRYELGAIRELLLAGQGDDDGAQILPDLSEDMSTLAMVEKCLMLLEKRRDALSNQGMQIND